jgi:hypothetical protein
MFRLFRIAWHFCETCIGEKGEDKNISNKKFVISEKVKITPVIK